MLSKKKKEKIIDELLNATIQYKRALPTNISASLTNLYNQINLLSSIAKTAGGTYCCNKYLDTAYPIYNEFAKTISFNLEQEIYDLTHNG